MAKKKERPSRVLKPLWVPLLIHSRIRDIAKSDGKLLSAVAKELLELGLQVREAKK